MKVILIEDEKLTAKDLAKTLVSIDPEIDIVAILHSVEESITFFNGNNTADLIFSDVQLGDGLSFEIFARSDIQLPIIFCTAFDQYSLEAFKTFSIDYILKPFSKATVERALDKFSSIRAQLIKQDHDRVNSMNALKNHFLKHEISVMVYQADKIIPILGSSIALFYIRHGNVYALTFELTEFLLTQSLETLEKTFSPSFFRVNRHNLINRKAVLDVSYSFNRKLKINIRVKHYEDIMVGKLKASAFIEWLSQY